MSIIGPSDLLTLQNAIAPIFDVTVQIAPMSGRTPSGRDAFGPAVSVPAYVQLRNVEVVGPGGQTALARGTIFLPATATIAPNSRITLPDGSTPPILDVQTRPELGNPVLKVVYTQ